MSYFMGGGYAKCVVCGQYSRTINDDGCCVGCAVNVVDESELTVSEEGWVQNDEYAGFKRCICCGRFQHRVIMHEEVCDPCYTKLLNGALRDKEQFQREAKKKIEEQKEYNQGAPLIAPRGTFGRWWL